MRSRVYLLAALTAVCLNIVKAQEENVVELDLNTDTLTSTQGVDVRYGNMKMKAFDLRRDEAENKVYSPGKLIMEADEPQGMVTLDADNGVVSLDGDSGQFGKSFGSIEVGQMTGAEAPNDKIYFGGNSVDYNRGNILLLNGWTTTDPSIVQKRDPKLAGYHFQSDSIYIEPDKQLTLKGSDLFIGKWDITPYNLPWYRMNIRQGSTVPLFPSFGSEDEYGFNTSWGWLWGDRDSKYKGGFAPKFAEYQGFLIGRWENWYRTDKYGIAKLNIDDLLVYKKNKGADDRWGVELTHEYDGEYGTFNMDLRNATYNMVPILNNLIDDYRDEGRFNPDNWNYVGMPDPYKGKAITFYTLDSDLKGLGENKDITFKSKVKMTDDYDAYKLIVNDEIDDVVEDYSLSADVSLYQDNDRYKIGGYYNYFYDPAPGSTPSSLKAKAENFGFEAIEKKNKLFLKYDETNEDKYRPLALWERNLNMNRRQLGTATTMLADYDIYTVPQYTIYDSKNLDVSAGDYKVNRYLKYKLGYNYKSSEQKLSLLQDPFRKNLIVGNERDKEFNRYENIIYDDRIEQTGYLDLSTSLAKFTLSGGHSKEEFWDRRGMYNYSKDKEGLSYRKYLNESDFFEGGFTTSEYALGRYSDFEFFGSLRYDDYSKGYNPYTQRRISTSDSSLRTKVGGAYTQDLGGESENRFNYGYQHYSYDSGDKNFGSEYNSKDIRLRNKYNTQNFGDRLSIKFGDSELEYKVGYEEKKRAYNSHMAEKTFKNELTLKPVEKVALKLDYDYNKRYEDDTISGSNYNDMKFENYGASFKVADHRIYYKNTKIDAKVWDMPELESGYSVDDSLEKIKEHRYGYEYTQGLNRLNLEYAQATDKRDNYTTGIQEIGLKNDLYQVSYFIGGDTEHRVTGSYEKDDSDQNRDLNSDQIYLEYDYKNKKFAPEDIEKYAQREYNKSPSELTESELDEVRKMVAERQNSRKGLSFDLRRAMEKRVGVGDYKEAFFTSVKLQRNQTRYEKTGNYLDSLQEAELRLYYAYNRYGFGYEYVQTSGYSGDSWRDYERDHKVSLQAKIGKPSEGWRIKTYAKFYDGLKGSTDTDKRKRMDGLGIELGKEMGYYEWSVAFLKEYSTSSRDYEWQAALQFTLLTFPDIRIFGVGADRKGSGENRKTNPAGYLFNGLKIKDYMD